MTMALQCRKLGAVQSALIGTGRGYNVIAAEGLIIMGFIFGKMLILLIIDPEGSIR